MQERERVRVRANRKSEQERMREKQGHAILNQLLIFAWNVNFSIGI